MTLYTFSVIIPSYNRADMVERCLDALAAQTYPTEQFEVIVVDDGSTDGTAERLRSKTYPFRFELVEQANGGASKARNAGAAKASGKYLAFTEDDAVPDANWLERAAWHFSQSALEMIEGRTLLEGNRQDVRRLDVKGMPSFIPCNLFVNRGAFLDVGGYDPAFYDGERHLYFREDADFGFRMLERKKRIGIAPDVIVTHPSQFFSWRDAMRHARRYVFDPLLYKKHPVYYRRMIEVKNIFGVKVRRVQQTVALGYLFLLLSMAASAAGVSTQPVWPQLVLWAMCVLFFRYKYEGRRALIPNPMDLFMFGVLPLVYLWSLARGAARYHAWGVMVP